MKKAKSGSQTAITEAIHPATKYDLKSRRNISITKKLAVFIGGTNAPLSLVDCPELIELLKELDPRYNIPHRKKLSREIDQVYRPYWTLILQAIIDTVY